MDGQLNGPAHTQVVGTDGLWAKLRSQAQRVVLLVVDSVSGLISVSRNLKPGVLQEATDYGMPLAERKRLPDDRSWGLEAEK